MHTTDNYRLLWCHVYQQVQSIQPYNIQGFQNYYAPAVGPDSTTLICPSCRAQIRTRVDHNSTTKTHIIAILLFVFCCWPCVCVPYCMDSCKNADHYCPNCNAFIGTHTH